MAAAHRHHIHAAPGMVEYLWNGFFSDIAFHHLAAFRCDLGSGGRGGVGLADIGLPETIQRLQGVLLT